MISTIFTLLFLSVVASITVGLVVSGVEWCMGGTRKDIKNHFKCGSIAAIILIYGTVSIVLCMGFAVQTLQGM